jgi:hypothetical protein
VAVALAPVGAFGLRAHPPVAHPSSAVSTFCSHLPASTVSATMGLKVSLLRAVVEGSALECLYFGSGAGAGEVVVSKRPGMPASEVATRAKAEATLAAESPKGVKITFASLPSVGPTAFSWAYQLNGGQLYGVSTSKGTTGYGVVLGGSPKTVVSRAHLSDLEHLVALAMKAG